MQFENNVAEAGEGVGLEGVVGGVGRLAGSGPMGLTVFGN